MPTYRILTCDLTPAGFEWRERIITTIGWRFIRAMLRYYESLGYTIPDSLRVERVEDTTGAKP